ncbi:hypothetical protein [Allohahella sp. A8]|uniref:hypothetical protein n=1 Tax=Allohahella sp. A8 TaxID=3141461 RepID=UPI003A808ACD
MKLEEDRIEVYQSSTASMVLLICIEVALGFAIYYFAAVATIGGNYVFIVVLVFFFLAIASGLTPLINNIRRGNSNLVWGADSRGFFVPATTTTFSEYRPPTVYHWSQIKRAIVVKKLIQQIDGTSVSFNQLIVILDDLQCPENLLFKYVELQYQLREGGYYQVLRFPEAHRAAIVCKLREFASSEVSIEELKQYEIR